MIRVLQGMDLSEAACMEFMDFSYILGALEINKMRPYNTKTHTVSEPI